MSDDESVSDKAMRLAIPGLPDLVERHDLALVPRAVTTCSITGDALIRPDLTEHERRTAVGLGALGLVTVDAMFSLPLGGLIRWGDIDPYLASFLRRLPDGIIERLDRGVCRLAIPPVKVELVVVSGSSWRPGLRRAGSFAPFAQRVLLLDQNHRIPKGGLQEADFWGVGVWQHTADGIEELVPPAPWRQHYFKPAGWCFRERAYASWLRTTQARQ